MSSCDTTRWPQALASADLMADLFRERLLHLFPAGATLKECRPEVLMARFARRQVYRYTLRFAPETAPLRLVVKYYADGSAGIRANHALRLLWHGGFDRGGPLRVPEPLIYLEDLRLLISEDARGTLLSGVLISGAAPTAEPMAAAARWLLKLHGSRLDLRAVPLHADETATLGAFVAGSSGADRDLRRRLPALAAAILERLSALPEVEPMPTHGDFQPENIFVDQDCVTVIDFDRFSKSDPARDVGYMLAQTWTAGCMQAMPPTATCTALRAFWEAYAGVTPDSDREALAQRVLAFAARKSLQDIVYILALKPTDVDETTRALLTRAERFAAAASVAEALAPDHGPSGRE